MITKKCPYCDGKFETTESPQYEKTYCSPACKYGAWRERREQRTGTKYKVEQKQKYLKEKRCIQCSKPVEVPNYRICAKCRVRQNQHYKRWKKRLKEEVFEAYGHKCNCCGETRFEFLGIDHVNGDGSDDRKKFGRTADRLYAWLRNNGFPKDRYQILCHNCNLAKGFYGYCPHQIEREKL